MAPDTIVLITGANSGIGLATAEVIASTNAGYHVVVASRNYENGVAAVEEVRATGSVKGSLSAIQLDVNDSGSIANAAKRIEQEFGRLDVLINNAGIAMPDDDLEESLMKTFRTNTVGSVLVTEAFRPLMLKSKNAYSLYVSSGLGSIGRAQDTSAFEYNMDYFSYRISKTALDMWVVQEDRVWRPKGIKTFAVCPGLVVSNLRGKGDEQRSAGGMAGDPKVSGKTMLDIIEGKRDADTGKFVHKDGVYPW